MDAFRIRASAKNQTDILLIEPLVREAVTATMTALDQLGARTILTPERFSFVLLASPPRGKGWDHAEAKTHEGRCEVRMVAPSAHSGVQPGSFPRAYDRVWYERNLIHECTGGVIWLFSAAKTTGWRLSGAPEWFTEGVQEYVAIEGATQAAGERYRSRYFRRLHSQTVTKDFVTVQNEYEDGYLILKYLTEVYGTEVLARILVSDQSSFWQAVSTVTDQAPKSLYAGWEHWRASQTIK
jgi:hypothetical protein